VFDHIRTLYVEEKDDTTLLKYAIKGMLSELDPHSAYLDEESFNDLQETTSGEFGGLGIEVGMDDGFVRVISPIDDTPAQRAGIQAGDLIIEIDGTSVMGMTLNDAVSVMRGEKDTSITLLVVREGEDKPLEFTIVRDTIQIVSVKTRIFDEHYAYVRIAQFQVKTDQDMEKALEKMREKNELRGLIIDLRNNPGGVLQASVRVADLFLDNGLVVYTRGRAPNSQMKFYAKAGDTLNNLPIVVLINDGSASASEIVAGALQDHKRAVIIGTRSFGKGSVQTVLPINDERAIKLTTARYYTPKGRSIQAEGIEPDIEVKRARIESLEDDDSRRSESQLSGHLESEKSSKKKKKMEEDQEEILERDNQLNDALNVLRAMSITLESAQQAATETENNTEETPDESAELDNN
jgi:carboxyl-terminal processing protease